MIGRLSRWRDWGRRQLFESDARALAGWRRLLIFCARLVFAVTRDAARGQLTLRAMSLVYTTLLSLVPLLAVSFSVLKAFGVHNEIQPLLSQFLAPLGPKGAEITARVVEFVENIKVGVLGALGVALLFYTVVALMQKIEEAFNATWRVRRLRRLSQRFSDYLSVLLIGPVLVFAALGITATVLSSETVRVLSSVRPFGALIELAAALVPYLLIILAFTFVYLFVPNTRVRPLSALVGAVVAGVLWQSTGWIFASFVAGSTHYTAIYSAFATLIMFMIWLYLSWLILLIGASVAYYHQHPRRLTVPDDDPRLSPRMQERTALSVMALVGQAYYRRERPLTPDEMAARLNLPQESVVRVVDALVDGAMLRILGEDRGEGGVVPATPPEETLLREVLEVVRRQGESRTLRLDRMNAPDSVAAFFGEIEAGVQERFGDRTLRDLVQPDCATVSRAKRP